MRIIVSTAFVLAFFTLLLPSPAMAQTREQVQSTTGRLLEGWEAHKRITAGSEQSKDYIAVNYFVGYVAGFSEATPFLRPGLYEIPKGTTMLQLCSVVGKYLEDHPEDWSWPAHILVVSALREAFPEHEE